MHGKGGAAVQLLAVEGYELEVDSVKWQCLVLVAKSV